MTYFKDLTRCTYGDLPHRAKGELAVGWLSEAHPFPKGDFPLHSLGRLASLAERPVNCFRGKHLCDICPPPAEIELEQLPNESLGEAFERARAKVGPHAVVRGGWTTLTGDRRSPWIASNRPEFSVEIDGREIDIGNGEIQVMGEGSVVYVAPTMILHYVVHHHYLPPGAFIEALRVGRVPDLPPEASEV